ncbi:hypothetical protein [Aeromonas phage phiA014L]|uniref:Uncharacterized protein n=1 Tax=Aeromonas phage phiA014L TaxID=3119844 RepID=A0ABZ2CNZ0_9CAUD
MSKKLRNLKFLNKQVIAIRGGSSAGSLPDGMSEGDALGLLCAITECGGWLCEECPVHRESMKQEKENG